MKRPRYNQKMEMEAYVEDLHRTCKDPWGWLTVPSDHPAIHPSWKGKL